MRKFYIFIFFAGLTSLSQAQLVPRSEHPNAPSQKVRIDRAGSEEIVPQTIPAVAEHPQLPIGNSGSRTIWEQFIGLTTYDNQSNNSMQHRVILDNDSLVHATWTMSLENNVAWNDRGTGYNSGESNNWGTEPYLRIENTRTGWPDLVRSGDKEMIFCHTGTGGITMQQRPTIGSGTWATSTLPTPAGRDFFWPRVCTDGNHIHLIALSASVADDGTRLNGVDGNLAYWRSDDNGSTWSVQAQPFEAIDSTEYDFVEADSYAIHARNGNVAVALFSEYNNAIVINSTDNGDNWTSTIMHDFPIPAYRVDDLTDIGDDGSVDTISTTDGVGDVIIDNNGMTHCFFGAYRFFDDTEGDSLYTIFLSYDMLYWNSSYGPDSLNAIGSVQEDPNDNDDTFDVTFAQTPDYRCSLCSMPSAGMDESGKIYVVYAAADEEYLPANGQIFRHLFIKSSSNFIAWSDSVELTPDVNFDGFEYAFPSMARQVNSRVHITAQRDYEPGLIVRGDKDDSTENSIIYIGITNDLDMSVGIPEALTPSSLSVYPNPSSGLVTITGENLANNLVRVYNSMGQEMLNTRMNRTVSAADRNTLDLSFLPAGIYTLAIGNGAGQFTKEILITK